MLNQLSHGCAVTSTTLKTTILARKALAATNRLLTCTQCLPTNGSPVVLAIYVFSARKTWRGMKIVNSKWKYNAVFALPEGKTCYQKLILGFCASLCNRFCLSFVALNKIDKSRVKAPRNGKRYFNFVAKFLSFDLQNEVNDTRKFLWTFFIMAIKFNFLLF